MNISTLIKEKQIIVSISGNLDGVSAPDFDKQTEEWLNGASRIVLDCSQLEYISSAGIRSLLSLARKTKSHGGSLVLCNPGEITEKVLTLSGFAGILPMYKSLDEALNSQK
jgi:anti-anti-sigma factor